MMKKLALILVLVLCITGFSQSFAAFADTSTHNPIASSEDDLSDPAVIYDNGYYYNVEDNNFPGRSNPTLRIWKADTLQGLYTEGDIRDIPLPTNLVNFWAPEIYHFNNKWYLTFSAEPTDNSKERCTYVMESDTSDVFGTYTVKANNLQGIDWQIYHRADGTYWGLTADWHNGDSIKIVEMANPYTVSGSYVPIVTTTQAWEQQHNNWVEGPFVFDRNGKIFMNYSSGGWDTDNYALGLMTFTGTASDRLDNASKWVKSSGPVFSSGSGYTGPGHNSIVKSPDGTEYWNVYHAHPYAGTLTRDILIKNWIGTQTVIRFLAALIPRILMCLPGLRHPLP
ncbi:family 43 glycosylhydrolase [Paenibacillus albus]|uniref:Glycosyl hydrolase family 43 n=1 Tax=Paenibacillus albus TaxID=2495582 RepID=A0A3S9A3M8_9BACL|nr:family 43 glycosylhydrolase [Paenibacillus albus]AZN40323.1 hypothetical protein EJC50_12215 [Paenibacillus albus]